MVNPGDGAAFAEVRSVSTMYFIPKNRQWWWMLIMTSTRTTSINQTVALQAYLASTCDQYSVLAPRLEAECYSHSSDLPLLSIFPIILCHHHHKLTLWFPPLRHKAPRLICSVCAALWDQTYQATLWKKWPEAKSRSGMRREAGTPASMIV